MRICYLSSVFCQILLLFCSERASAMQTATPHSIYVSSACQRCRSFKKKCDDQRPCARCVRAQEPCQEAGPSKKRGPKVKNPELNRRVFPPLKQPKEKSEAVVPMHNAHPARAATTELQYEDGIDRHYWYLCGHPHELVPPIAGEISNEEAESYWDDFSSGLYIDTFCVTNHYVNYSRKDSYAGFYNWEQQ